MLGVRHHPFPYRHGPPRDARRRLAQTPNSPAQTYSSGWLIASPTLRQGPAQTYASGWLIASPTLRQASYAVSRAMARAARGVPTEHGAVMLSTLPPASGTKVIACPYLPQYPA